MSRHMINYEIDYENLRIPLSPNAKLKDAQELVQALRRVVPSSSRVIIYRHYNDGSVTTFFN